MKYRWFKDKAEFWKLWPKGFGRHRPILLATRVLPASPNFGQAKHGQNGPAATDCQQGICCPICEHHFTHWTHPDISFRFRAGGQTPKTKKFPFFTNLRDALVKKFVGLLRTQFATDLPHSSFEPLYPKLFGATPEVDLVSTVWPPDLPKVRWCPYLTPRNGCFRCFFGLNKFSRPNGGLSPIACYTYLESYDTILVHPTRRQIFARKPYSEHLNIWDLLLLLLLAPSSFVNS